MADLAGRVGAAVHDDVVANVQWRSPDPRAGATLSREVAAHLAQRHELSSPIELALLALPASIRLSRASISGFRVPAIGIEAGSGDLILGANLEFPGSDLTSTVHAEGFVALRVRRRGQRLATLVVPRARPCAFCRQTLAETAGAAGLRIVDPLGNDVSLEELYPWAFQPDALGAEPDTGALAWPDLDVGVDVPPDVGASLVEAGSRAHTPYTRAPSAAALRTRDGRITGAGCVESVAFNPTTTALQAALVEITAAGYPFEDVVEGWLARTSPAPVDPAPGFRGLLAAVAPAATAHVIAWQAGER